MTATEARVKARDKYKTILGRNKYSQAKRTYVNTKYKDGNYYSDCSSSVAWALKQAGYPITYNGSSLPSTVGFYLSKDVVEVPVKINSKGEITNPEVLCIADSLLFAGTDSSRAYAGYVGHVEMVGEITGGKVYLYGHGSGTPRRTEMQAYLRKRRGQGSNTKLGHRGLIKVVRRITDDSSTAPSVTSAPVSGPCAVIQGGFANVRTGPGTNYKSVDTVKTGDTFSVPDESGWVPIVYDGGVRWVSEKYARVVKDV